MTATGGQFGAIEFVKGMKEPPRLAQGSCRSVWRFHEKKRIGEGTYGTVYRAVDRDTGEVVALKKVILHNEQQVGFPITSIREVRLLKRACHPNCVRLRDVVVGSARDSVFLVFEYCEHDMASLMETMRKPFSEAEVGLQALFVSGSQIHAVWGGRGCA